MAPTTALKDSGEEPLLKPFDFGIFFVPQGNICFPTEEWTFATEIPLSRWYLEINQVISEVRDHLGGYTNETGLTIELNGKSKRSAQSSRQSGTPPQPTNSTTTRRVANITLPDALAAADVSLRVTALENKAAYIYATFLDLWHARHAKPERLPITLVKDGIDVTNRVAKVRPAALWEAHGINKITSMIGQIQSRRATMERTKPSGAKEVIHFADYYNSDIVQYYVLMVAELESNVQLYLHVLDTLRGNHLPANLFAWDDLQNTLRQIDLLYSNLAFSEEERRLLLADLPYTRVIRTMCDKGRNPTKTCPFYLGVTYPIIQTRNIFEHLAVKILPTFKKGTLANEWITPEMPEKSILRQGGNALALPDQLTCYQGQVELPCQICQKPAEGMYPASKCAHDVLAKENVWTHCAYGQPEKVQNQFLKLGAHQFAYADVQPGKLMEICGSTTTQKTYDLFPSGIVTMKPACQYTMQDGPIIDEDYFSGLTIRPAEDQFETTRITEWKTDGAWQHVSDFLIEYIAAGCGLLLTITSFIGCYCYCGNNQITARTVSNAMQRRRRRRQQANEDNRQDLPPVLANRPGGLARLQQQLALLP